MSAPHRQRCQLCKTCSGSRAARRIDESEFRVAADGIAAHTNVTHLVRTRPRHIPEPLGWHCGLLVGVARQCDRPKRQPRKALRTQNPGVLVHAVAGVSGSEPTVSRSQLHICSVAAESTVATTVSRAVSKAVAPLDHGGSCAASHRRSVSARRVPRDTSAVMAEIAWVQIRAEPWKLQNSTNQAILVSNRTGSREFEVSVKRSRRRLYQNHNR
jgi:hypothetical protein